MKKPVLLFTCSLLIFFSVSCSQQPVSTTSTETTQGTTVGTQILMTSEAPVTTLLETTEVATEVTTNAQIVIKGEDVGCLKHVFGYHETPIDISKIFTEDQINEIGELISNGDYEKDSCSMYNTYMLIRDYNIQREDFENACYKEGNLSSIYTPERIDALYSSDMARINEAFYDPFCSIYHDGEIYDMNWILSNRYDDYAKVGIPLKKIMSMIIWLIDFPTFTYYIETWINTTTAEDLTAIGFSEDDITKVRNGIQDVYKALEEARAVK